MRFSNSHEISPTGVPVRGRSIRLQPVSCRPAPVREPANHHPAVAASGAGLGIRDSGAWRQQDQRSYPSALFLIAVGAYSTNNNLFEVGEALLFGVMGAVFKALNLSVAPILLGYVLGPLIEENFRRALVISDGNLSVFIERPISATFLAICALLILAQMFFWLRRRSFRANTSASGSPVI